MGNDELESALGMQANTKLARNILLFLGDGMGVSTLTAARILKGQLRGETGEEGKLYMETFPHHGLAKVNTPSYLPKF